MNSHEVIELPVNILSVTLRWISLNTHSSLTHRKPRFDMPESKAVPWRALGL